MDRYIQKQMDQIIFQMNNITMLAGKKIYIKKIKINLKNKTEPTQISLNRIYGFDTAMLKCNKALWSQTAWI